MVHDILLHLNCKEREARENGQRESVLRELEVHKLQSIETQFMYNDFYFFLQGVIEGISELVDGDRQFLLFDLVSIPTGQMGRKERAFFLFSDILVITSIKRRGGTIRKPSP